MYIGLFFLLLCSLFSVSQFFVFLFFYCYSTFLNITDAFLLPFAFRIFFAGHVLSTFISDVNVREKRWLQKKQSIFNILLQVSHLHEIWLL